MACCQLDNTCVSFHNPLVLAPIDWRSLHGEAYANVPVLVTGGAGFIGSHLVHALHALGADIRVFDNLSEGSEANLPANVKLHQGDLRETQKLAAAIDGVRIVFHLAALVSVPRSITDPLAYHEVNATGTVRLLEAARKANVLRACYSASSSAYGESPTLPKRETMPDLPVSPYASSKLAGEHYVRAFANCYQSDAVSLRYFNIFGPRQKADSAYAGVVAAFAKKLLAGEKPTIYGDGSASRDFTFVANAVHANLLAGKSETRFNGEVANVGTARRITVLELANAMAMTLGREDLSPLFAPARLGDVQHSLADLSRAKSLLNYDPIVSLEDGLAVTLEWYKQSYSR